MAGLFRRFLLKGDDNVQVSVCDDDYCFWSYVGRLCRVRVNGPGYDGGGNDGQSILH